LKTNPGPIATSLGISGKSENNPGRAGDWLRRRVHQLDMCRRHDEAAGPGGNFVEQYVR
jgi:hypothetical protein